MSAPAEAPNEIRYNGKTYTIAPVHADELVRATEDHFRSRRLNPVDAILPELEKLKGFPEAQKHLVDLAYKDLRAGGKKYSREDLAAWLDTREGVSWLLWYQLHKNHPEVTVAQVETMVTELTFEEAIAKRDAANKALTEAVLGGAAS